MRVTTKTEGDPAALVDLFAAAFTASEGAAEGARIGALVRDMIAGTPAEDIRVFVARADGPPLGAAIFTPLRFAGDPRRVVLLSPMAVAPDRQGEGIGQALLRHALAGLREDGVDVAMTYGDPAFYGRVGFRPVRETTVPAPLPLSMPHGWIGQCLTGAALTPFAGPSSCVAALNDPQLW